MAAPRLNEPWHRLRPESLRMLREDIEEHYPTLHVIVGEDDIVRVAGMFPVRDAEGTCIDGYEVRLDLPPDYPRGLPEVYETGGRIPWTDKRHVNTDGTACVMMPEERHRIWPRGEPLSRYLDGPLRNFFLGQLARDHDDPWPFDEWSHGEEGFNEFVQQELGSSDPIVIRRFLWLLQDNPVSYRKPCPCGSHRQTRDCCRSKIVVLRRVVSRDRVWRHLVWLMTTPTVREVLSTSGTTKSLSSWCARMSVLKSTSSIPVNSLEGVA